MSRTWTPRPCRLLQTEGAADALGPRFGFSRPEKSNLERLGNIQADSVEELHRVGQEDDGERTNEYENMIFQRDGMIALAKLAEAAIHKGEEAINANIAAIKANNSLLTRVCSSLCQLRSARQYTHLP